MDIMLCWRRLETNDWDHNLIWKLSNQGKRWLISVHTTGNCTVFLLETSAVASCWPIERTQLMVLLHRLYWHRSSVHIIYSQYVEHPPHSAFQWDNQNWTQTCQQLGKQYWAFLFLSLYRHCTNTALQTLSGLQLHIIVFISHKKKNLQNLAGNWVDSTCSDSLNRGYLGRHEYRFILRASLYFWSIGL